MGGIERLKMRSAHVSIAESWIRYPRLEASQRWWSAIHGRERHTLLIHVLALRVGRLRVAATRIRRTAWVHLWVGGGILGHLSNCAWALRAILRRRLATGGRGVTDGRQLRPAHLDRLSHSTRLTVDRRFRVAVGVVVVLSLTLLLSLALTFLVGLALSLFLLLLRLPLFTDLFKLCCE